MAWTVFAEYTPGETHVRVGLPCQDFAKCIINEEKKTAIFAVADGHGNRKHFRSERGAVFACETALKQVESFLKNADSAQIPEEEALQLLKQSIIDVWRVRVGEDAALNKWTSDELAEQKKVLSEERYEKLVNGEQSLIPYGSTLLIGFRTANYWCGLQLGDGGFVEVMPDGSYIWPIPESQANIGIYTSSLCMKNPMPEFHHYIGTDHPVALLAFSDGIEKSFPSHSMEIASYLHRILRVVYSGDQNFRKGIQFGIQKVATTGRVKDDVSIAGFVDLDQENPEPKDTEEQQSALLARIELLIQECDDTISYYEKQKKELFKKNGVSPDVLEQIECIVQEKELQREELVRERALLHAEEQEVDVGLANNPPDDTENKEPPTDNNESDNCEPTCELESINELKPSKEMPEKQSSDDFAAEGTTEPQADSNESDNHELACELEFFDEPDSTKEVPENQSSDDIAAEGTTEPQADSNESDNHELACELEFFDEPDSTKEVPENQSSDDIAAENSSAAEAKDEV